uniref:Uncharacterized protein n=1 Tax=Romanomermis culicivorax TaxID=13658 RepID=A0A915IE52_ROMCU
MVLVKQRHSIYTTFARQLTKQMDLSNGIPELPIPGNIKYLLTQRPKWAVWRMMFVTLIPTSKMYPACNFS